MARIPDWRKSTSGGAAWDACWIGHHYLPGRVKIKVKKSRDIDVQKSPEVDGAKQVNKGIKPAEVEIELVLFDNNDAFQAWCEVLKEIDPHKPGAYTTPYEILNPEPNHLGVTKITVTDIESESPESSKAKTYKIKCQQWFPKAKASKTKKSAAPKGGYTLPEMDIIVKRPSIAKNSS